MHRIITLLISVFLAANAIAVPAFRSWITRTLTDGREVMVMSVGDENGHWFVDEEGRCLMADEKDRLYYVDKASLEAITERCRERITRNSGRRAERLKRMRHENTGPHSRAISGNKRGVVILVEFPDVKFSVANGSQNVNAFFNKRFNDRGEIASGYVGSVSEYFYDQSYGKLNLHFDVVGPITVSEDHSYYGYNVFGDDAYVCQMVCEAVKKAHESGTDFSLYDWDGDGEVEQIAVIYAGTGENRTQISSDIWPCEATLSDGTRSGDGDGAQNVNGVTVDVFAISSELAYGTTPDGIGTICHEYSHSLGFPDYYDVYYSGGKTMLRWDVMSHGNYNGPRLLGEVPSAMTAYEKWTAGWLTPIELSTPQMITEMPALESSPVAYVIYNDRVRDEFFMLENRQPIKWDSYITADKSAHGLFITHIDYDAKAWKDNEVNTDPNHQRMIFVAADNSYGASASDGLWYQDDRGYAGDCFPGSHNVTEFSDDSTPSSTLYWTTTYYDHQLRRPIYDIRETNGLISFAFMMHSSDVDNINSDNTDNQDGGLAFTLQGQCLGDDINSMSKGIYIRKGKKIVKTR